MPERNSNVLVLGANGQVGHELVHRKWPKGLVPTGSSRGELDCLDFAAIERVILEGSWAAVVNCAAYTAVDRAEIESAKAWALNAAAPEVMGRACHARGIPLLHVSTDYVFPGSKEEPYEVEDAVGPLGVYGASKLGGEIAVRLAARRHAIVRTSWVVSARGSNFVKTMLRLANERDEIGVVDDQFGSPTIAGDLASALMVMAERMISEPAFEPGTLHFTNAGRTSWAGFAREIFRQSNERGGPDAIVNGIASDAYPTRARRPYNSQLSLDRLHRIFGLVPRDWQDALADVLDALIGDTK